MPRQAAKYTIECVDIWPDRGKGLAYLTVQTSDTQDSWRSIVYTTKDFATYDPEAVFDVHRRVGSMWLSPTGTFYAIDSRGELIANGKPAGFITKKPLLRIWGLSSKQLYVIGRAGLIMRLDGKQWHDMTIKGAGVIHRIGGTAPDRLFAATAKGLYRWNGSTWRAIKLPKKVALRGLYVDKTDVLVTGEKGFCAAVADAGDAVTVIPGSGDFEAVARFAGEIYVGGGAAGILMAKKGALVAVKPAIPAYSLTASSKQLVAAGGNAIAAFDGSAWNGYLHD